jgi:hypothetical protein
VPGIGDGDRELGFARTVVIGDVPAYTDERVVASIHCHDRLVPDVVDAG